MIDVGKIRKVNKNISYSSSSLMSVFPRSIFSNKQRNRQYMPNSRWLLFKIFCHIFPFMFREPSMYSGRMHIFRMYNLTKTVSESSWNCKVLVTVTVVGHIHLRHRDGIWCLCSEQVAVGGGEKRRAALGQTPGRSRAVAATLLGDFWWSHCFHGLNCIFCFL